MQFKKIWLGFAILAMTFGLIAAAACGDDAETVIVEKEVVVEKEIVREVPKEVVVEVEKEVIVEREVEVIKEVEVIVEVEKSGPEITGIAKRGGTLVYGSSAASDGLHPHQSLAATSMIRQVAIHEGLVERDWSVASPELKSIQFPPGPNGVLAESWSLSDDKLTWTFNIRRGVKFHDGSDFNAQVAEMNYRTLIDDSYEFFNPVGSATAGFTMSHVDFVRAVDEYTLEVTLNKPFFGFIDKLSSYPCCNMVSGRAIETMSPNEISENPVGTSHFKFVEWKRGERLELDRFEDYWNPDNTALVDTLIIVPIVDQASRVAALLAGEIDIAEWLSPDNLILVRGVDGFEGYARGGSGLYGLEPNHREPPFDDHRVRQAASLCFDREKLANELMKGIHEPGAQIWGAAHEGYDPNGRQITDQYDPERAKELMAEAGYADGFKTKLYSSTEGLGVPELVVNSFVAISLRECGMEVELVNLEWMTYLGYWSGGIQEGENIGFFTMGMGAGDVAGFDQYIHSSGWPPSGWSVGWYDNADVDALVEKSWNAATHAEYLQFEREAHELALQDYAYIPVLEIFLTFGVSERVGGWTGSTDWISRFNKAWVEYER